MAKVDVVSARRLEDDRSPPGAPHLPSGTEEPPGEPAATPAARALLLLLRVTGLVTDRAGPAARLYAALAFVVNSAGAGWFTVVCISTGRVLQGDGHVVVALSHSGFFGLMYVLMWMSMACCFLWSREQYGEQLTIIRAAVHRLSEFHGSMELSASLRRNTSKLLAVVVILFTITVAVRLYYQLLFPCGKLPLPCLPSLIYLIVFCWSIVSFCLVPFKYVLSSLYVESGLQKISTILSAMVEERYQPDPAAVCDIISLHGELSRTFGRLTRAMSAELVLVMASGTIICVTMLLTVISSLTLGTFEVMVPMLVLYTGLASVTMVLPSEAIQRCLEAAGEARELLLAAELRQPPLSRQLGLLRESVGRDLDTLGELGLFRLRRSTVLSISSTILTNAIIMLQFYFA
ncbi:uncharacterized protein LOC122375663 [Amphibalanus amphitrite]|uniref:uncharacterized protein LOC122375663 n=1 Tax=Amphibalanus amphitrite TaxID=1232801 RepID=UPI001C906A5F|nr:uncharacterized protein LOC122375663 [Amphibalanus amphitrite]